MSSVGRRGIHENFRKKGPAWVALGIGLLLLIIAIILASVNATSSTRSNAEFSNTTAPVDDSTVNLNIVSDEKTELEGGSAPVTEPRSSSSTERTQGVTNNSNMDVDFQVNGQDITVPENGSIHKEVETEDGKTTIDISTQSNASNELNTRSSMDIDIDTSTRTRIK